MRVLVTLYTLLMPRIPIDFRSDGRLYLTTIFLVFLYPSSSSSSSSCTSYSCSVCLCPSLFLVILSSCIPLSPPHIPDLIPPPLPSLSPSLLLPCFASSFFLSSFPSFPPPPLLPLHFLLLFSPTTIRDASVDIAAQYQQLTDSIVFVLATTATVTATTTATVTIATVSATATTMGSRHRHQRHLNI